eukprot:Platyproteum_vivax@DN5163_c0_g1_i2.p1
MLFGDSKYGLALLKNTYLLASKYSAAKVIDILQNLELTVPPQFRDVSLVYELNRTVKPQWSKESLSQIIDLETTVAQNRNAYYNQSNQEIQLRLIAPDFLKNLQDFHPSCFRSLIPMLG